MWPVSAGAARILRVSDNRPVDDELRYTQYDDRPGSTHELVVGLVPPGSRVLELGCATGYMSAVLAERLGCRVTGVEIDAAAAERAQEHCERVVVADADSLDFGEVFAGETFDCVVAADVLEHLRDPGRVLRAVRGLLGEGGVVVASVPNVAHGSVRLALLAGEFRYRPTGLLDETHLRFFTRASLYDLFESSGFVIAECHRQRIDVDRTEIRVPDGFEEARAALADDPEATAYQFVVRAFASDEAGQIAAARAQAQRARDEAAAELDRLSRAHEARGRQLASERLRMAEQVERELDALRADIAAREDERRRLAEALERAERQLAELGERRGVLGRLRGR
jgi:O-antigen biosynthesis protein